MGSKGAERANFSEWMEETCSVRVTNRRREKFFVSNSGGVAVVGLYDPAELLLATDAALELRSKGLVQNLIVHADTSMRTGGIVVPDPCPDDVVQLIFAEAHEIIETFVLEGADEGFDEG